MRITIYIITILFISGCKHELMEPCKTTDIAYEIDIKPIIITNCATSSGCHGTGSSFGNFNYYKNLNIVCENGKFQQRVFWKKDMPPFALTECELIKLKKWYHQGHSNK